MKLSIIDPQNDQRLVEYILLKSISMSRLPFNFYSIIDYGIRLNNLLPTKETMLWLRSSEYSDAESFNFDSIYANQLLNYEPSFIDLMNLLSNIEYQEETILMSNYNNKLIMPILDSLLKLIQERYGIDYYIINVLEDIDSISFSEFASPMQYSTFITDIQRYYKLTKQRIPVASEEEIEEDLKALRESIDDYYGNI